MWDKMEVAKEKKQEKGMKKDKSQTGREITLNEKRQWREDYMESCKEGREERKRKGMEEGANKTDAEKEMKGFYLDSIFLKLLKQTNNRTATQ